ncbi:hypothetical protein CTEN210_03031 [Chaetoceros tenuissimus]|uniref:Uncharacterized protein n=1 Tax=Chaetoceros tenuissimus TaxID=426638 RepID=A0AAD3CI53_9STRA|nr:hypothetical protein CTEN210_03031 [Chaetoceros tenuissimus]
MSNAVTAALNSAFNVDSPGELADHVMYCLPPTVNWDGIAYAYVNNWNSVYNDEWCTHHARNWVEKGAVNMPTCQNFQRGWFALRHKVVSSNYVGELRSTLEYDPNDPNPEGPPMLIKVANGGSDFFIAFNRATSYNAGTKEGQNQVMITQAGNRSNFVRSYIQVKLGAGASHTFTASGVSVTVSVQGINTFRFGFANISICFNGNCDTQSPTRAPTTNPTISPTKSTEQPSPSPSAAPTACLDYDWNLRFFVEEVGGNRSCEWVARTSTALRCSYVEPAIRCRKTCNMCASSPSVAPTISFHPSVSTSNPSASPTSSPSASPTTAAPTDSPTASTASPTASPTTAAPANASTQHPTYSPTNAPSKSNATTSAPFNTSTQQPSPSPTLTPTSACILYNWNRKGCKAMSNCSYNNRTKQCVMLFPASAQRANECYSSKQSCSLGACCSGICERNGKWAGTCK